MNNDLTNALASYQNRTGHAFSSPTAVLFDMDGVLYDSMPGHAIAWSRMCADAGLQCNPDEFFAYEGRTGADTINILYRRQFGHGADDDTCRRLYAIKSAYFKALGEPQLMEGAADAVKSASDAGLDTVLVTGSGQASILDRLSRDYPGAFSLRVTAHNVTHGKPHPEPYLRGMELANTQPWQAIAVDNAPLGVESAAAAGAFTIGVRTGPIPAGTLKAAGADIEVDSMHQVAHLIEQLAAK